MFKLDREPNPGFYPTVIKEQFPDRPMIWYDKGTKFTWTANPGSGQQADYNSVVEGIVKKPDIGLTGDMQIGDTSADDDPGQRQAQVNRQRGRHVFDQLDSLQTDVQSHVAENGEHQEERKSFTINNALQRGGYASVDFGPILPVEDMERHYQEKSVQLDAARADLGRRVDEHREELKQMVNEGNRSRQEIATQANRTQYANAQSDEFVEFESFHDVDFAHFRPPPDDDNFQPPGGSRLGGEQMMVEEEEVKENARSQEAELPMHLPRQEEVPSVPVDVRVQQSFERLDRIQAELNEVAVRNQIQEKEIKERIRIENLNKEALKQQTEHLLNIQTRANAQIEKVQSDYNTMRLDMVDLEKAEKRYMQTKNELEDRLRLLSQTDIQDPLIIGDVIQIENQLQQAKTRFAEHAHRYTQVMQQADRDYAAYLRLQQDIVEIIGNGEFEIGQYDRVLTRINQTVEQAQKNIEVKLSLDDPNVFFRNIDEASSPYIEGMGEVTNDLIQFQKQLIVQSKQLEHALKTNRVQLEYQRVRQQQQSRLPQPMKHVEKLDNYVKQSVQTLQKSEDLIKNAQKRIGRQISQAQETISSAKTVQLLEQLDQLRDPSQDIKRFTYLLGRLLDTNGIAVPDSFKTDTPDFRYAIQGLASLQPKVGNNVEPYIKTVMQQCNLAEVFLQKQQQKKLGRPIKLGPVKEKRIEQNEMMAAQQKQTINQSGFYKNTIARGLGRQVEEAAYQADTDMEMRNVEGEDAMYFQRIQEMQAHKAEKLNKSRDKSPVHFSVSEAEQEHVQYNPKLVAEQRQARLKKTQTREEEHVQFLRQAYQEEKQAQKQKPNPFNVEGTKKLLQKVPVIGQFFKNAMQMADNQPAPPPRQQDMSQPSSVVLVKAWAQKPISKEEMPSTMVTIASKAPFYAAPQSKAPDILQSQPGISKPNTVERVYIVPDQQKVHIKPEFVFPGTEESKTQPVFISQIGKGTGKQKPGPDIRSGAYEAIQKGKKDKTPSAIQKAYQRQQEERKEVLYGDADY